MARRRSIQAGLDIGTQKVAMVIAEETEAGLEVLGVGTAMSRGIRAGRVCDVEKTTEAIGVALSEAELMAGCQIHQVTVGVSGDHLRGTNSHGVVAIENGEVSARSARRVIEAAQAVPLPADQAIVHLMCREYIVDGQGGILDPVGINGIRLEANLHIISACESALGNLSKCCNKAGLSVDGMMAGPVASAEAVLEPEERDLGVALVDFGAGTVDICVYHSGGVVHSSCLTVAGLHVTSDLSRCLEISMREAEILKVRHAFADPAMVDESLECEVNGVGGRGPRMLEKKMVAEIVGPRIEEIFEMVAESIDRSGYADELTSGVVLTGGSAMLPGITEVASRTLQQQVRLGEPQGVVGLSDEIDDPSWAAAVGLARGLRPSDRSAGIPGGIGARVMPQWLWRKWKEYF